jgi:hypothetical protein
METKLLNIMLSSLKREIAEYNIYLKLDRFKIFRNNFY